MHLFLSVLGCGRADSCRSDSPAVVVDCDLDCKLKQNISFPMLPFVSM